MTAVEHCACDTALWDLRIVYLNQIYGHHLSLYTLQAEIWTTSVAQPFHKNDAFGAYLLEVRKVKKKFLRSQQAPSLYG